MPAINRHEVSQKKASLTVAELEKGLGVITDPRHKRVQDGFSAFGKQLGRQVTRSQADMSPADAVAAGMILWSGLEGYVEGDPQSDDYRLYFVGGVLIGHLKEAGAEGAAV